MQEPIVLTNAENVRIDPTGQKFPLYRRDYRRSAQLARIALSHTHNPHIQAESYFLLARAEHAEGPSQYIDALSHVSDGVADECPSVLSAAVTTQCTHRKRSGCSDVLDNRVTNRVHGVWCVAVPCSTPRA